MRGQVGWRDGPVFASAEVAVFAAIFVYALTCGLPISNTPWLFLLGSAMLLVRGRWWGSVGFRWPERAGSAIALGLAAGVALSLHELVVLEPVVRSFTGASPDLSFFKELKGDLRATLFWIALSWVLAGFGEEMVWRGYAMNRVAALLGGTSGAWALSTIAVSILFGVAHGYQDLTGMIVTGTGGALFAVLYLLAGRNLVVPIMAHGMSNTVDFLFMYWGGIIPGI